MIKWHFNREPLSMGHSNTHIDMEGFYKLSGPPAPLKEGERRCGGCGGYGHKPRDPINDPNTSYFRKSVKCGMCEGRGKE